MAGAQITDHNDDSVTHGRETVNGVRLHYVTAGSGEPLLLLHGVPKTSYYWHRLIPQLTDEYTVVAPDIRGFGDSENPDDGYDIGTIADDVAELMSALGHDRFSVHGEDWGAAYAYALAASHRDHVEKLSFAEMLLPGQGLEDWATLSRENLRGDHPWLWHISFFHLRDFPEMLITGRERAFWSDWMKAECYDPSAIDEVIIDEVARCSAAPGGLRSIFAVYRATFENMDLVEEWMKTPLDLPILTIGSKAFINEEVERQMERVGSVDKSVIFEECGHSLALEAPDRLTRELQSFI